MNVTDRRETDYRQQTTDRQTDGRQHIANVNMSEREHEFTFAKNPTKYNVPAIGGAPLATSGSFLNFS